MRHTIATARESLKEQYGKFDTKEWEQICQLAIEKIKETTEWNNREFSDEEIKNAISAYLQIAKN